MPSIKQPTEKSNKFFEIYGEPVGRNRVRLNISVLLHRKALPHIGRALLVLLGLLISLNLSGATGMIESMMP